MRENPPKMKRIQPPNQASRANQPKFGQNWTQKPPEQSSTARPSTISAKSARIPRILHPQSPQTHLTACDPRPGSDRSLSPTPTTPSSSDQDPPSAKLFPRRRRPRFASLPFSSPLLFIYFPFPPLLFSSPLLVFLLCGLAKTPQNQPSLLKPPQPPLPTPPPPTRAPATGCPRLNPHAATGPTRSHPSRVQRPVPTPSQPSTCPRSDGAGASPSKGAGSGSLFLPPITDASAFREPTAPRHVSMIRAVGAPGGESLLHRRIPGVPRDHEREE